MKSINAKQKTLHLLTLFFFYRDLLSTSQFQEIEIPRNSTWSMSRTVRFMNQWYKTLTQNLAVGNFWKKLRRLWASRIYRIPDQMTWIFNFMRPDQEPRNWKQFRENGKITFLFTLFWWKFSKNRYILRKFCFYWTSSVELLF